MRPDDYPDSFSAKGAIVDGLAVCEGISKAFKLLMIGASIISE